MPEVMNRLVLVNYATESSLSGIQHLFASEEQDGLLIQSDLQKYGKQQSDSFYEEW